MSDEFFAFTRAREGVTLRNMYEWRKGGEVCVADLYRSPENTHGLAPLEQAIREHPDAYFHLDVPVSALGEPPPDADTDEGEWWEDEDKWRAYCDAVRDSLEEFINRALESFSGMVRAGCYFVFAEARAKVTECEPIPDEVFEEMHRDLFKRGLKSRRR